MALDMLHYLPNDILTKVDRAAMAVTLETRVPLLDPNVIEFAASLPLEFKMREGVGKWALRQVLYKYVPKDLIERPKMGFGVPLAEWLRGPLKDWAEVLLDEKRLLEEGFFNVALVRQKWLEHSSGLRNWQAQLWDVLMFQAWLEENR
jgi:asparagine synthase (glutamine-hydrolysing)